MNKQFIQIAEHCIEIDKGINLPYNFNSFKIEEGEVSYVISSVSVGQVDFKVDFFDCKEKSFLDLSEELFLYKTDNGSYHAIVKVHSTGDEYFMHASSNWNFVTLSANCKSENCPLSVINKFLMLTFIYASSFYKTVLLHASSVRIGMDAVAFIGNSGVGKSTHSRLWLKQFEDAELINDDQPAVRVFGDSTVRIYGTPWSGKTHCYKSVYANLRGIIGMKQAKENIIIGLSPLQLLAELFASCSMMKSDTYTFRNIVSTIVDISSSVRGFILENKPELQAALLAYNNTIGLSRINYIY